MAILVAADFSVRYDLKFSVPGVKDGVQTT